MKKKTMRFIAMLLSFLMVVTAMPSVGTTVEAAAKPRLAKKSVSVVVGGTAKIGIKNAPKKAKITYRSAKKSIATVTKKGVVKGIKSGTAKITVTIKKNSKTVKLTCKVTVKRPQLSKTKLTLTAGKTAELSIKNKPAKATYTWKTSAPKVAAVNKSGKVTARAKGTATIQVKVKTAKKTYTLSCKVTVRPKSTAAKQEYTVTFNSNGGSAVASQTVKKNARASRPADPARSGYTFDGWYTAANGGTQFDFNTAVTANITLYARWSELNEDEECRITFDLNDGSANVYQTQTLQAGETVVRPEDPTRDLYRFTGWYTESAAITEYDFDTPVVSDLTLYAGWGNPDGSDDLYAASDESETIYSITGIEVNGNEVSVTYNTDSKCLLTVEFFEDLVSGSDWSEEAQASNLGTAPIATASGYTEDYGEMAVTVLPIDGALPEDFVVRATLVGTGEEEDPTYVTNQYTATYKQFDAQTVDSVIAEYGEDQVINFDSDRTTNFGVLKDSVKIIPAGSLVNGFEVTDVKVEDETVPDHHFIFTGADDQIQSLQAGDVIYLEGTTWLFKIATVSNDNGTVTMTQDRDAIMTDFYDVLQVDMESGDTNAAASSDPNGVGPQQEISEEAPNADAFIQGEDEVNALEELPQDPGEINAQQEIDGDASYTDADPNAASGISPQWEIIDVNETLSGSIGANVNYTFDNGITLTGSITGKITGKVKMSYDAHLFSKDYFEASVTFETKVTGEVKAGMDSGDAGSWKDAQYKVEFIDIKLPTPITGLDVYVSPDAVLDWKLSGSVGIKIESTQTSGFTYNSDTGRTDIKKKENKVSLSAEGKAEVKIGPRIDIGVKLLGGVLSAGVTAEAGAKFTATVQAGFDDLTNTVDSKHACGRCVSGKAEWYATAAIKCSYKITDRLKGDIAKLTILDFSTPIYFRPGVPGEFFVSVINEADSPFGGAITFGGGSCTNKRYRTELQVQDEDGQQINGAQVSVVKQGQTSGHTGTSPHVIYLYEGTYKASANVDGTNVSKTFVVSKSRQTVVLTLLSADSVLEGSIVDADDDSIVIGGASVKVSKDGVVVASATSDGNGGFSLPVPDGSLKVEISKDGYLPFTSVETVYEGENHPMGLIRLTPGSGMGGFRGVIRDATDNEPLSGVTLNLYKDWNSTTEANTAIRTLTTNSSGAFRCETMTVFGKVLGLPSGNYTLTASKEGYSDTSYNIVIYPGTTDENPEINETMSPTMNEGFYRIILTWGQTPRDLDSHLVADTDTGSGIHVYYSNKNPYPNYADLDVDDTTSYGPETVTISNFEGLSGIRYAVHDYTNRSSSSSTQMSYSGATVRIFKGNKLLRTFNVPTGYGGTEWDVFSMDTNGRITTINSMTYTRQPTSVLGHGRAAGMEDEPEELKDYELSEMAG